MNLVSLLHISVDGSEISMYIMAKISIDIIVILTIIRHIIFNALSLLIIHHI